MTASLDNIQTAFQERLLNGSGNIHQYLADGGPFMKVYEHAYVARQQEIIGEQFPALMVLLGDDQFAEASRAYIKDNPPSKRSARWIGEHLPSWLAGHPTWSNHPVLVDMASFEWALAHAFDAPDAAPLTMEHLAAVPPDVWPMLMFEFQPALSLVELSHDVAPFQHAVVNEQEPSGAPALLDGVITHAVWRDHQSLIVQYRALDHGETIALTAALNGMTFTAVCEHLAEIDEDNAAGVAAGYLRNWVETGLLSGIDAEGISWSRRA